jgi:hypothetical protein
VGQASGRGLKGIRNEGGRWLQILQAAKQLRALWKPAWVEENSVQWLLSRKKERKKEGQKKR